MKRWTTVIAAFVLVLGLFASLVPAEAKNKRVFQVDDNAPVRIDPELNLTNETSAWARDRPATGASGPGGPASRRR